jgi:hypothetical protein
MSRIILVSGQLTAQVRELQLKLGSVISDGFTNYATTSKDVTYAPSTAGVQEVIARGDHLHHMTAGVGGVYSRNAFTNYTNNGQGPVYVFINATTATGSTYTNLYIGGAETCRGFHPMTDSMNAYYVSFLAGVAAPGQAVRLTSTTDCTAVLWFQYQL